jgi:putrescine transport system ATP-binding protein
MAAAGGREHGGPELISSQRQNLAERPWLDPAAKPQIVLEGLGKSYGEFAAVGNVNLSIYKGEMFALVGASGCGKTTLLRMLAGFVTPTAGRVLIDDVDMTEVPPYERPVNMMFQSYALFPHMTVEDNVGYGLKRMNVDAATRRQRVAEALEMVQLGGLGPRKPHQLSGGQRQRVALARAVARRAALGTRQEAAREHAVRAHGPAVRGRHHLHRRHP